MHEFWKTKFLLKNNYNTSMFTISTDYDEIQSGYSSQILNPYQDIS